MKGIITTISEELFVVKTEEGEWETHYPLHPSSIKLPPGTIVEFDIIDEFTNPELYEGIGWGDGQEYAIVKK
jgi:hypothetical protein